MMPLRGVYLYDKPVTEAVKTPLAYEPSMALI